MVTKTAHDFIANFDKAIAYTQENGDKTNKAKDIRKYNTMIDMLLAIPENITISADGVGLNSKQDDFEIANCGSLAECVVRVLLAKRQPQSIAKRSCGKTDWNGWEIKTAMNCRWLATPSKNRKTILVNACGCWVVENGKDIPMYVDKQGRLPYNRPIGEQFVELEDLLGLWD